jgi:hypothetical protein
MEAAVIRFTTALFDVSKERPNPINPISGESLLWWLAEQLRGRASLTSPDAEDWGWYSTVEWNGRRYMLGSSTSEEEVNGMREWILQIVKHRSLRERLMGQERMTSEDPCVRVVLDVLKNEPALVGIALE